MNANGRKYSAVMNAKVIVMPKAAVLDPQGNAVRDAMRHLGIPEVRSVRIGKYMEIDIEGQNDELESRLHQLCRDLLSNPVIEDYELLKNDSATQKAMKTKRTRFRQTTARRARPAANQKKKTLKGQLSTRNIRRQKRKRKSSK